MKEIRKLSNEKLIKILGIITLSDGCISKNKKYLKCIKLTTVCYNKCQHDFFKFLCKCIFNKYPSTNIYNFNSGKIMESKLFGKEFILKLLDISPSFKTTPNHKESKEEFLKSKQPSLKFIFGLHFLKLLCV